MGHYPIILANMASCTSFRWWPGNMVPPLFVTGSGMWGSGGMGFEICFRVQGWMCDRWQFMFVFFRI